MDVEAVCVLMTSISQKERKEGRNEGTLKERRKGKIWEDHERENTVVREEGRKEVYCRDLEWRKRKQYKRK